MKLIGTGTRIDVKNILFLTDFSEPSNVALPFAMIVAREFGAKIHVLHVVTPDPYLYMASETACVAARTQEQIAQQEMDGYEARLAGLCHDVKIVRGGRLWPHVESEIAACAADLVVLGTHGRTGAGKLLLGSSAEEVLRRSEIPVLTIGPSACGGLQGGAPMRRIIFATDFTPDSLSALPYAVSFAQQSRARLTLLHVIRLRNPGETYGPGARSVAGTMHELYELVHEDMEIWCRPETLVAYGEPAEGILHTAVDREADLIVLGVHSASAHLGSATHLGNTIAHKVVAHACCPVLTVRC